MNNAEITGFDAASDVSGCRGGYWVQIIDGNRRAPVLANQLPGLNLGPNPVFPIPVKIDWEAVALPAICINGRINITKIALR
jgi:hypothetical protein